MSVVDIVSPPARVGPECNGMLLTPEEYDVIEDWDEFYRYELVHGVLIVVPPAGAGERSPNDELGFILKLFQTQHANGTLIDETLPEQEIRINGNRRRADRAIWIGLGRTPVLEEDVPTIAVEFVSRGNRDRHRDYVEKRKEYAEAGVKEYWIIDRFRREMTVFRGAEDETIVPAGGVYRTDLLPGFELVLDRLLEKADLYRQDEE